mgnify:FL=1
MTRWHDKTVLFDLDGTLIDTAPDLHASLCYAFDKEGLAAVDLPTVRSAIGHGARAMIQQSADRSSTALSTALLDQLHQHFLDYYVEHIADHSKPFDGIIETLDVLKERQAKIAVCTNKTQILAERLLGDISMADYFDVIVGADRASEKKPSAKHIIETVELANGRIDDAVMIGDSSTDAKAAAASSVPFIYMTYGYPDAVLGDMNIPHKLDTARNILAVLEDIFS